MPSIKMSVLGKLLLFIVDPTCDVDLPDGKYEHKRRLLEIQDDLNRKYSKLSYRHQVGTTPLQYIGLGETLENSAEKWPDVQAVISREENKTLTYSQLREEADKLAIGLKNLGLSPGDRFGIWSPNSTQWLVALMAAARSGVISVAMNPMYMNRELKYCIKKVGIKALIAQENVKGDSYYNKLLDIIPELEKSQPGKLNSSEFQTLKSVILVTDKNELPGVVIYNKLLESVSRTETDDISRNLKSIKPDSGCNIQFTSGTTGFPKAPLLSHYNIVNNGYNIGRRNQLGDGHKTICVQVPLFHVFGVVVTASAAIQHGATLLFPSAKYSTKANVDAIIAEKCDIIHGTPTMHIDLVNEIRARGVTDIKAELAVTGGSPVTPQLINDLRQTLNVKKVNSVFGMTEGTAVCFQSMPGEDTERSLNYVGVLHDHLEAKIVDSEDNIVPFGTRGELMTRGYSVMKTYWDDENKTDETITKDGWLRSGDQMVLHEDGYGQIVGRLKDLIIRGGENIAPKEIEDVISNHPDVIECQVFGVHDDRLGEEVCAAVRVKEGVPFNSEKLQMHCLEHLAKFKTPKLFKRVEAFPKTASGKVQKYKLRNMVESGEL